MGVWGTGLETVGWDKWDVEKECVFGDWGGECGGGEGAGGGVCEGEGGGVGDGEEGGRKEGEWQRE